MTGFERIAFGAILVATASPALASTVVPAPVAGVGIGAVLLLGIGYRALKRRHSR